MLFHERRHKMNNHRTNNSKYTDSKRGQTFRFDKTCRIFIDNLNFKVTEEDLNKLFDHIGAVRKVSIFFTKEGRSSGTGEVTFFRPADATQAMRKYNNMLLDGRMLKMKFVEDKNERGRNNIMKRMVERKDRSDEPKKPRTFRQNPKKRSYNKYENKNEQKQESKPVTKEQLDNELSEIMMEM